MSAVDPMRPETWSVAQDSALSAATRAAIIGDLPGAFSYAIIPYDGEITVESFTDAESMRRALAALYIRGSKWQYPLSWANVLIVEPDKSLVLHMEIEYTDEDFAAHLGYDFEIDDEDEVDS